jgi:hypothetical protein
MDYRHILTFMLVFLVYASGISQTFNDRRVINAHSVELLKKRKLDLRISHRFGDMFGDTGGWDTFYGLENAADILIGADYGITDRLNIGISRTKGGGPINRFINGFIKVGIFDQESLKKPPLSISLLITGSISTMNKSNNPEALSNFSVFQHRIVTTSQFILAKKFGERFSLQVAGSYTHRNQVLEGDSNDLFSMGIASRLRLNRVFAVIVDANIPFSEYRSPENDFYTSLGFGLEIETGGGHVFQINVTNAKGISENDYIPYTQSDWGEGEFRLGFTISRIFNM